LLAKNYWQVANLLVYAATWKGALPVNVVNLAADVKLCHQGLSSLIGR
jgi:hypothetical protein